MPCFIRSRAIFWSRSMFDILGMPVKGDYLSFAEVVERIHTSDTQLEAAVESRAQFGAREGERRACCREGSTRSGEDRRVGRGRVDRPAARRGARVGVARGVDRAGFEGVLAVCEAGELVRRRARRPRTAVESAFEAGLVGGAQRMGRPMAVAGRRQGHRRASRHRGVQVEIRADQNEGGQNRNVDRQPMARMEREARI